MSNVGAIVFSRMNSSRLPGKALRPIGGRSLVGRVVDRCRRIEGVQKIVLATSHLPQDDALEVFAEAENIPCFRGDLDDVAGRALKCANEYGFDAFVRVCGDRPFHDPEIADRLIDALYERNLDLATNALTKTWPAGMACEVIRRSAMAQACLEMTSTEDREHVTRWFYNNQDDYRIFNLESGHTDWADVNLAVDTKEDFDRAIWLAEKLKVQGDNMETSGLVSLALEYSEQYM